MSAQEVRYYKFSGREVRAADSADYIRVIPAPEPGALQHTSPGIRYACTPLTEMPAFPQGDKGLGNFLGRNIKYPPGARSQRITGTVILELTGEEGGILKEIGVSGSAHPLLDEEAVRVLRLSREWKRGREPGVPLPFTIRMPITFKLSGF